jgi:Fe-S oxidoreductase
MKYASLGEVFSEAEHYIIENCSKCGECISLCPIYEVASINNVDPSEVASAMWETLMNGDLSEISHHKAFSCSGCEECLSGCPVGINPMMFNQIVRRKFTKAGEEMPGALGMMLPLNKPFFPEILGRLQEKKGEAKWKYEAPINADNKDTIIFLGCTFQATPDKIKTLLDVVDEMNIDYEALVGGKICCGITHQYAGEFDEAEKLARNLIDNLERYSPKRVVVSCPTCYNQLTKLWPNLINIEFEVIHLPEFIYNNLDRLKIENPINKKVTLHEPCHVARSMKEYVFSREILKALPGLELIEMTHNRNKALCCGGFSGITFPEYGQQKMKELLQEGKQSGADAMINMCPNCHVGMTPISLSYSLELTDIASLIYQAIKGEARKDKLRALWEMGGSKKVFEATKGNIESDPDNSEFIRNMLPVLFDN